MRQLSKEELKVFESIVSLSQDGLKKSLYKVLKEYYKDVTVTKDFLYAIGDIPIALVAHLDTVFKEPTKEVFYDKQKNVIWSPQGGCGDDRAGVFAILNIITDGFKPHIIFTTDEEIGGIGSQELSLYPIPFKDLRYIIQLDRRGANDCVFYDCDNPEFEKYVESFGFVTNYGSFTDICNLCPSWGMAGVNLSIGYRDEHSVSEILFVGQMFDTIKKVKKMLSEKEIPSFKYIPMITSYYPVTPYLGTYRGHGYYDDYEDYWYDYYRDDNIPSSKIGKIKCYKCGSYHEFDDLLPVKIIKGTRAYFCEDCLINYCDCCASCGEIYEVNTEIEDTSGLCLDCKKKMGII